MDGIELPKNVDTIFENIDFTKTEDAVLFNRRITQLRDSMDLPAIFHKIDAEICPEKRRYSLNRRAPQPYGYYMPSEAMLVATSNIQRGRLLKKTANPYCVYDYDASGKVVRIAHMHSYKHLLGKVSCFLYLLYSGHNVIMLTWNPKYQAKSLHPQYRSLFMLTLHIRDANGNTRFISESSFTESLKTVASDIEVYSEIIDRKQTMDRYYLRTDPPAEGIDIIATHFQIQYGEDNRMLESKVLKEEKLATKFPFR